MTGEDGTRLRFGEYELDTGVPELRRNGELVDLTPAPARALALLVRNAGQLVTREELYQHLWPEGGVDVDRALNTHILQIRRALGERSGENRFIRTHPGMGYRFLPEVRSAEDAEAEPDARAAETRVPRPAWAGSGVGLAAVGVALALAAAFWPGAPWISGSTTGPAPLSDELRVSHLTGLELLAMPDPERRAEAARHFRRVTAQRPDFAPAQAGLAESLVWAGELEAAGAAARVALALDPDDVRAHRALGTALLVTEWAWAEAKNHLRRAVELDPGDAESHLALAFLLVAAGRTDEGLESLDRGAALEPASPTVTGDMGILYGWIGEHERALELCTRTIDVDPSAAWGHRCVQKAKAALGRGGDPLPEPDPEAAGSHYRRAVALARLGRTDEALTALEESARAREMGFVAIGATPELEGLRGHPAFQELLDRLLVSYGS